MDGTNSSGYGVGGGEDASVADEWREPGKQVASKWSDGGSREVEPNDSGRTGAAEDVSAADAAPAPFPFSESGTLVEVRLQLLRLEGIRLHGAGASSSSSPTPESLKSVALRRSADLVRLLRGEGTRLVRVWLEWLGPDGQALFSTHDVDVHCRSRRADFRHQQMVGYSLLFGGPTDDVPVRLRLRGSTRYRQRFSPHVLRLLSAKVDPVRRQELLSSPDALTRYLQSLSVDESVALSPKPFPPDRWHQWPYHKVPDEVDRAPDFLDESSPSPRPGNRHHRHHHHRQRSPASSDASDRRLRFPNQLGVHGDPDDVSRDFDHWDAVTLGTFEVPVRELLGASRPMVLPLTEMLGLVRLHVYASTRWLPQASTSYIEKMPLFPDGHYTMRVHVHEVSSLQMTDGKARTLNPYVVVELLGQKRQTHSLRDALSGVYDRLLFFSSKCAGGSVRRTALNLSVWSWNFWRPSFLVGSYSCDFMHIWNQPHHGMEREWLSLTSPTAASRDSAVIGYVRVSVAVFGPGIVPRNANAAAPTTVTTALANNSATASSLPAGPRLLKNMVLRRPTLTVDTWRLQICVYRLELGHHRLPHQHDNGSHSKSLARLASMLSRRADDDPDDERHPPTTPHRVFLEVAYAADAKHDTLQSAPRLLRDGVATFDTGFCLPVLLTNTMQANFEDVVVHVKAADGGATLAEMSLPLGELLASGCTTEVHYIDDHLGVSRFAQAPDDAPTVHPTDDACGQNVPSGVSTSALARQMVVWVKELAAEPVSPHVRQQVVYQLPPRYHFLYSSHASCQGRLLASMRLWRHSASSTAVPLWSHPLGWAERYAAAAHAPPLQPFVLTARVYQITELFLPDDTLVCAKLFLGDRELHEFPAVPVRDHTAVLDTFGGRPRRRSRDGRASDGFPLQLEPDCEVVPDLFLNVYQVHGHPHRLERVMFLRLRAKALRMLAGREAPMWWLLDNHRRPTADLSTHAGLMYALFALRTAEEAEAAAPMSAAAPELSRHSLLANSDRDGSNQSASVPPVATARNLSLRCHLLECRDVPSGDATGFSDPFVSVRWGGAYTLGRKLTQQTCDPQFYESITVGPVRLHPGEALPRVSVKVFDWDGAVEAFDPAQLQHTTYLCRALVQLASSRQRAPQWYPMFVANPLVPRGSLLAAFEVIDADTQTPVAIAPDDDPATAVSRPLRWLEDDRHSLAPSQTHLRIGVVGFRNLSFADDPPSFRREPLVMRFYLNFQDGEAFTHAVPVQRVEAFCAGSGEVLDVVDVPCPRDRRSKPSLHVIVEAKASGRFVASANITVEELAAPRLLPGGRLQYALESLRVPVGGAVGQLETPSWLDDSGSGGGRSAGGSGGETANTAPSMPQPSRQARQVLVWLSWQLMRWWQWVTQSAAAAALIALFNQLLEQFPDVALHFGLEEVEIPAPPSTKQSAAGAGADATSSSSASAVAIRGEASDASDDTPDVATVAFRAAHAGQTRDRVPRELEHFLGDCAAYHEFLLRRGWKRERGFYSFREVTAATSRASTSPSRDATARASSSRRSPRQSRGSVSRSSAATVKMPVRSRQPRLRRAEEIDAAHLIGELAGRLETPYPVGKLALVVRHGDDDCKTGATPTANARESSSADTAVPAAHALRSALRQTFRPVSNAVVRVHLLQACNLHVPSGAGNIYVNVELNGGEQKGTTRSAHASHSLQPLLFHSMEFRGVSFPGARLTIRVKNYGGPEFEIPNVATVLPRRRPWSLGPLFHTRHSRDLRVDFPRGGIGRGQLIGITEIDLDQRWYARDARTARLHPPVEVRNLYNTEHLSPRGQLEMYVELLSATEAAERPFEALKLPRPQEYELRLVVWRVVGCQDPYEAEATSDSNSGRVRAVRPSTLGASPLTTGDAAAADAYKLQDLQFRAQLANDAATEMRTDIVRNCDDGAANFNYRLVWRPIPLPDPELVPRLRLHVWDVRPRSVPIPFRWLQPPKPHLVATATLDIAPLVEEVLATKRPVRKQSQWITMRHTVAGVTAVRPRAAISLELLSREHAQIYADGAESGNSNLPPPLRPVPFSAFAPHRYVRYRVARVLQDSLWEGVAYGFLFPVIVFGIRLVDACPWWVFLLAGLIGLAAFGRLRRVAQMLEEAVHA